MQRARILVGRTGRPIFEISKGFFASDKLQKIDDTFSVEYNIFVFRAPFPPPDLSPKPYFRDASGHWSAACRLVALLRSRGPSLASCPRNEGGHTEGVLVAPLLHDFRPFRARGILGRVSVCYTSLRSRVCFAVGWLKFSNQSVKPLPMSATARKYKM